MLFPKWTLWTFLIVPKTPEPRRRAHASRRKTAQADGRSAHLPAWRVWRPGIPCACDRVFRFPPEVFQTPEVPPLFSLTRVQGAELLEQGGAELGGGSSKSKDQGGTPE